MSEQQTTFYDAVGGAPTFERLVAAFYRRVPHDPILGPMYPPEDMSGAEARPFTMRPRSPECRRPPTNTGASTPRT